MSTPAPTYASAMPDAHERISGGIPLVLNHRVPGLLHAALVRSPVPHAEIRSIDVGAAAAVAGVHAVLTATDLAPDGPPLTFGYARRDQAVLAHERVRYVGDPVAVVVADTPEVAAEACSYVDVDYADLPYTVEADQALVATAPLVHPDAGSNRLATWRLRHGDPDTALAAANRVYDDTYHSPPASHVPMEPHVAVADWDGDTLTVWTSTQAPHVIRETLAATFGCAIGQVRVRTLNVGGAYGSKVVATIEPVTAAAARVLGRPVRLELSRSEVFHTIGKHAAVVRIRTGVRHDGTIVARSLEVTWNAGAYATNSPDAAGYGLVRAPGPYRVPHVAVTSTAVYTNTVPSGPFRGAMTSQLCWAYESQLDDIAADLGMDPVELRRRNLLRDGDRYATGEVMHDLHYDEILDALDTGLRALPPAAPVEPGHARGTGVALMIKSTQTPSRSECRLRLHQDGTLEVLTSSVEIGQGAHATMRYLAAEALGVPEGDVVVRQPDTLTSPFDSLTASSRTTFAMGSAVRDAAARLRADLRRSAARLPSAAGGDLTNAPGGFGVSSGDLISYADIIKAAGGMPVESSGLWQSTGGITSLDEDGQGVASTHWHQGGVVVEVDVDLETGKIQVLRAHGACYAGRVLNPVRVAQQNEGDMIFGLGPALYEELIYQDGQLVNPNLSEYMIPSIEDIPVAMSSTAIERQPVTEAELHGVGEMTVPPMAPAIGNAVRAACGVRIRQLPMGAERVLRTIDESMSGGGS